MSVELRFQSRKHGFPCQYVSVCHTLCECELKQQGTRARTPRPDLPCPQWRASTPCQKIGLFPHSFHRRFWGADTKEKKGSLRCFSAGANYEGVFKRNRCSAIFRFFFGVVSSVVLHFLRITSDVVDPSTGQRSRSVPPGQLVRRMMRHMNLSMFCAAVSFEDPLVYARHFKF